MAETSIAPESLTKLVWRLGNLTSPTQDALEDLDGGHGNSYSEQNTHSKTSTGDNVHLIERYLFEATKASKNEVANKWKRFVCRVENDHYTRSQIEKIMQNLDKKKQYSALHYAIWHNNLFAIERLIDRKSKFSSDVNILTGNGEHVLHIIAQANSIWKADSVDNKMERAMSVWSATIRTESQNSQPATPKVIQLLLPLYKTFDYRDNEQRTPLHVAVLLNRIHYAEILLRSGADLSAQSIIHNNVFHYVSLSSCSSEDKDQMFDLLIHFLSIRYSLLVQKNLEGLSPFSMAIGYGTPHMINSIVSRVNINLLHQELPICIEMLAKRSQIIPHALLEHFLLHHYNPSNSANLLHIICHYNNPELLRHILDHIQRRTKNFSEILNKSDEHGYTPLLTAIYYGHQSMVEILLEHQATYLHIQTYEKQNLLHLIAQRQHIHVLEKLSKKLRPNDFIHLMSSSVSTSTPLHEISRTNNVQLCRLMLQLYQGEKITLFKHQDSYGQTIYHRACDYGRLEMIQFLTSPELIHDNPYKFKLLAIGDDEKRTCLHLAAAQGHADVVAYLLHSNFVNINALTDKNETAFHYACRNGHRTVVVELLAYDCDTLIRNAQLYNGLELSILNHNEDVARLLTLEYRDWRPMFHNAQKIYESTTDAYDTPLRKLIRYMPELAMEVIDEQFTRINGAENMTVDKQIYDYEFFEDQLTVKQWYSKASTDNLTDFDALVRCCGCFTYRTEHEPYTGDSYTLVRNHPLFIVSDSENQFLMEHPFCQALRANKYAQFGRYLLVLSFILYVLYLCAYTAIILRTKHPKYFYDLVNQSSFDDEHCASVASLLAEYQIKEAFKDTTFRNLKIGIYSFLIIFIVKNTILILTLFPRLFRKTSYYLEGAALILAFVCVLDSQDWLDPLLFRCPTQYQIGTFALLLSWINFLAYVRCIPVIGIYVVMLQVISKKFLRFLPVLLVLILGFGFTYYALLQNQEVYSTPVLALVKTSLIMFEMNFDDRIYDADEGGVNYYPITFVLFVLTGYVMTIFVINLLIGLAVGEIPTLVEQGTRLQSRIYYDNLSDYEILRLQVRSLILWLISHLCCCCSNSFKYHLYRLIDRSFLRQRPILFQISDRKQRHLGKRLGQYIQKKFFTEQIQESIDQDVKQRYEQRKQTKIQRAKDDENREKKELAYSQGKIRLMFN